MERFIARLRVLVVAFLWAFAPLTHAEPENGWWWNPNESGRGFYIETWDDVLFMAGYFYEEDGRSTWLISAGGFDTPYSYAGRLLKLTGGQTLLGDYQVPTETDVGEITIEFTDDTHGTLVWPGGTIAIERQVFATGAASFQPTGWWWNSDESGRGYCIEVQGEFLFLAAFMYDAAGNPIWFISAGRMASPTHYEGALLQVTGGQTLTGSYHPPAAETPVGTVTIDFGPPESESATLTLSDEVPVNLRSAGVHLKQSKVIEVIRFRPKRPKPSLSLSNWNGFYREDATLVVVSELGRGEQHLVYRGTATYGPLSELAGLVGSTIQDVFTGTLTVTFDATYTADGGTCKQDGELGPLILGPSNGSLTINQDGTYVGNLEYRNLKVSVTQVCNGIPTGTFTVTTDLDFHFGGHITSRRVPLQPVARHLEGRPEAISPTPGVTVKQSWDFTEILPLP